MIASDLRANRRKYERYLKPGCLKGADVQVIAFEQEDPPLREAWDKRFASWGAASVRFVAPDESLLSSDRHAEGNH